MKQVFVLISYLIGWMSVAQGALQIQIISPPAGTIVTAGQTITISAIASGGNSIHAALIGQTPLGVLGVQTGSGPYEFPVTVPTLITPGSYSLTAVASSSSTSGLEAISVPVHIVIERSDMPTQMQFDGQSAHLRYVKETRMFHVYGLFSDGTLLNLTNSSKTSFTSGNTGIVSIMGSTLTATGVGSTTVTARYGTLMATYPVTVDAGTVPTPCTFTVLPGPLPLPASGGTATISVTSSAPTCAWGAFPESDWINLIDPATGTGTQSIGYSFGPNSGSARSGGILIAGQELRLTQAAAALDTTPPVIVPQITGTLGNNGWYRSSVIVSWNVTDPESGIPLSTGCTTTTLMSDTAGVTLTCSATNGAGIQASIPVTIKIDQTAPVAMVNAAPTPNANGWNNMSVAVSYSGTDNLSGIDFCSASVSLTSEGAGQTVSGTCTDKAGNVSAPVLAKINIDKTAPVAAVTAVPTANGNGWNDTTVTVSLSGTDNLSGIDFCSAPMTFINEGAAQMALGTCTDKAGNVSAPATAKVNIDKTPPVISGMPSAGCTLWPPNHKLVQVATLTAADALSGLAPGSLKVTGTSNEPIDPNDPAIVITPNGSGGLVVQLQADRLGTGTGRVYKLTATANDLAGNAATTTATCAVPHDQAQ
jgi:hypothetical protein